MTFVIVGAGPAGIELAGALGEIAKITLKGNFRLIDPSQTRIILLEGTDDVLPGFDQKLVLAAKKTIRKLGVDIRTSVYAENIDHAGIAVRDKDSIYRIESKTVIWSAGVKASSLGQKLVCAKNGFDRGGRVIVNTDLSLPDHEKVFVIGDLSSLPDESGKPLPALAPVAMSQELYVAKVIRNRLQNKNTKPYRYKNKGIMAVIGRAAAIVDLGWLKLTGYPAWILWLFVHIMYLVEYENRLLVFLQWVGSYITSGRRARLVTRHNNR